MTDKDLPSQSPRSHEEASKQTKTKTKNKQANEYINTHLDFRPHSPLWHSTGSRHEPSYVRTPKARTQSLRRLGWLPTGPAVFLPSGTRKTLECGACQERVCTLTVRCPEASSVSFPSISPLGWAPAPCPAISWLLYLPLCSPHLALPCSHGCPDLPPTPHSFLLKPTFLLEGGGCSCRAERAHFRRCRAPVCGHLGGSPGKLTDGREDICGHTRLSIGVSGSPHLFDSNPCVSGSVSVFRSCVVKCVCLKC